MAGRRRRFAAKAIDLGVVFFAYIGTYWVAALLYYAVSGCADTALTTVCGSDDAGGYVVIVVFILGFVFPLLYESALRRTLGKTALGLDVVGPDGRSASRSLRLKRSIATWAPLLALAAATLSAPGDVSAAAGSVLFFYVVGVCALILWKQPPPWDRLLGTRVIDRRAGQSEPGLTSREEGSAEQALFDEGRAGGGPDGQASPARRRYRKAVRRR